MATIFEDDFNSYNDGNLGGQGGWSDLGGTINVQGVTVKEGAKAIVTTDTVDYRKTGTLRADGRIVVYLRHTSGYFGFQLWEGAAPKLACRFDAPAAGNWSYLGPGANWVKIGDYTADEWFCAEIEWRSSDKYFRFRMNAGNWTNWVATNWNFVSGLDIVRIETEIYNNPTYIDYIAENPYVPPAAGRSYGFIFAKIYENLRNLAQRIFRFPALVNPGNLPAI